MTEEEEKKYLSSLNKIIKSGNPKYLSYISKEYMRNKDVNPQVALAMFCMIQKEASDEGSVYGIFLDANGSVNLDAMSDISKITNLSEFIGTVEELSEFDIDFSDLTADELIIEGEQIAEELAREAESLEQEIDNLDVNSDTDLSQLESDIDSKTSEVLTKATAFAGISAGVMAAISRIKSVISRVFSTLSGKKTEQQDIESEKENSEETLEVKTKDNRKENDKNKDEEFCPRVDVNVGKVMAEIEQKNIEKERIKEEKLRKGITTDDDIDDNPADDFLSF